MLAVEFPSPYDGSESTLRSVFGGLDKENRALRRNAISTARNSSQGLAL
jgi:hypothetical protein